MTTPINYLSYIKSSIMNTWHANKGIIIAISLIFGSIYNAINSVAVVIGVHALFLFMYILLVIFDTITGIAYNVYYKKEQFTSSRFLKKIVLAGFSLFMLLLTEWLVIIFTDYSIGKNELLGYLLSVIVLLAHIIKIAFMIGFIIYELTSLKENLISLKLREFVRVIDMLLKPLSKIEDFLDKKFQKTIDENLNTDTATTDIMPQADATADTDSNKV